MLTSVRCLVGIPLVLLMMLRCSEEIEIARRTHRDHARGGGWVAPSISGLCCRRLGDAATRWMKHKKRSKVTVKLFGNLSPVVTLLGESCVTFQLQRRVLCAALSINVVGSGKVVCRERHGTTWHRLLSELTEILNVQKYGFRIISYLMLQRLQRRVTLTL